MIRRAGFGLLCLLAASAAAASDLLPLKRGIYVAVGVPCKGASNADTLSYWGDRNGINASKVGCTIKHLERNGAVYTLERTCRSIYGEGPFENRVSLKLLHREAFVFSAQRLLREPDRTYRYCGPKVQF